MKDFTGEEIRDKIISIYGEEDVDGHGKNHIIAVFNLSTKLLGKEGRRAYNDNVKPLTVAAIYHDMFSRVNRKEHATLAAEYVMNDNVDPFLKRLNKKERVIAAYAILKHRSSDNTSIIDYPIMFDFFKMKKIKVENLINAVLVAKILRAADKGVPDLDNILERAIAHTLSNAVDSEIKDHALIVYLHIREKFGRGGYIYENSPFYNITFKKEIEKLCADIESLNVGDVKDKIKDM